MTSTLPKSIAFYLKSKEIDSTKWSTTRKLLIEFSILSKYLRSYYPLKIKTYTETIPRKLEKYFSSKRHRFGGGSPGALMVSSSVKYESNYRASRLAHYQDKMQEDSTRPQTLRPSRRGSNLSGYSVNTLCDRPLSDQSPLVLTDDEINNNEQRLTTDEIPPNDNCKVSPPTNTEETIGGTRQRESSNELNLNPRSQSVGPASNINNNEGRRSDCLVPSDRVQRETRSDSVSRNNQSSKACYFCWCCCCSCACQKAKPKPEEPTRLSIFDEQLKLDAVPGEERFTLEEIQKWAHSFELLIQSLAGRKIFQEFLKMEYSEENIMFYKAVEDLHLETNERLVEEKARSIYEDYISILSPKEVSLDSRVRELINSAMAEPSSNTFDEAQLQIFTLMQRDSYPRFLNSRLYKDLYRQVGGTSTTSNSQTLSEARPANSSS